MFLARMFSALDYIKSDSFKGFTVVFGAFLTQLTLGTFHGTFGNLLPYISSYLKQYDSDITHGDVAMVLSVGGLSQGIFMTLGGLVLVPLLGKRVTLVLGCLAFIWSPVITYFFLRTGVIGITISYGVLSASSAIMLTVPLTLIPVTWFPSHKGKVIGIIVSGFGFSSFVMTPIQTFLVNPSNIPVNSTSTYFESKDVLDNLPYAFLYMGALYTCLLLIGVLLTVEKPAEKQSDDTRSSFQTQLRDGFLYLAHHALHRPEFYLLFFTRVFSMSVTGCVLAHWKTFLLTKSQDDQLIALVGGVNGVMSCLSRFLGATLLDKYPFNRVNSAFCFVLTGCFLAIYFVARISWEGLVALIWAIFGLSFSHFSTVPTQV